MSFLADVEQTRQLCRARDPSRRISPSFFLCHKHGRHSQAARSSKKERSLTDKKQPSGTSRLSRSVLSQLGNHDGDCGENGRVKTTFSRTCRNHDDDSLTPGALLLSAGRHQHKSVLCKFSFPSCVSFTIVFVFLGSHVRSNCILSR